MGNGGEDSLWLVSSYLYRDGGSLTLPPPFCDAQKRGGFRGGKGMGNCATQLLTSLSRIYMTKATKKRYFFSFLSFSFFGKGEKGVQQMATVRSPTSPHPSTPLLKPSPPKKPSRYGIRIYECAGINFEAQYFPKKTENSFVLHSNFRTRGRDEWQKWCRKKGEGRNSKKREKGDFSTTFAGRRMLFGFELKLPVCMAGWRKGGRDGEERETEKSGQKGWINFGMTDLGCVRKRNRWFPESVSC